jgi:dTDP-3-amino-3,4,6-trideoxy-alpha-D-glucose transaminase
VIPVAAPQLRLARYADEIETAVRATLADGRLILGERLEAFEGRFADFVGVEHCVGVNSGTDAIALALRACGVGPGDEVITVSMTAAGTGMGILQTGAEPRFVDVDPATRCIAPDAIEAAIGPRTVAIVPVHLHGHPADMPTVMSIAERHELAVVEDCAQAHGAIDGTTGRRAGSFGRAAAFSFYPTKNLGCAGDGGAVVTGDEQVADRLRSLRSYGWQDGERVSTTAGFNSRLDEVQAAILGVMLDHLEEGNRERAQLAAAYRGALDAAAGAGAVTLPPDADGAAHHQFAIECEARDELREWLAERGIGTGVHYPAGLHDQPAFAEWAPSGGLPVTERLGARLVSLPVQPEVAGDRAGWIGDTVAEGVMQCAAS